MNYLLIPIIVLILAPSSAHAFNRADVFPVRFSARHGSEVRAFVTMAQTLKQRGWSTKEILCSMARIMPKDRGGGFHEVVSSILASSIINDTIPLPLSKKDDIKHEKWSMNTIRIVLTTKQGCPAMESPDEHQEEQLAQPIKIPLDKNGIPLSGNDVWNACVRRKDLSVDLLRSNKDVFVHRQGRKHILIPWSCRDYHRGREEWWIYPDIPNVTILLSRKGKYIAHRRE